MPADARSARLGRAARTRPATSQSPLTPDERKQRGAPSRLLALDQVADAVVRLATDESLQGRVLVWWSEDEPHLIPWGDVGYAG